MACKYDEICKHKRGDEGLDCEVQGLCKFYGDTLKALEPTDGKHYESLTPEQGKQIVTIADL